ncbi:SDR family oxidoreductase [Rariglobus hedericola]|uniref:NAD-dependent epimerase/dehydratase family protein n=1 Tax=Rariglobus hedericola TaxID=2597822 RepID=A0A556QQD4_9BACT|nr:SDR family oxidoreductase [Rariglobus hedericola]TSJ78845.1 NAD-dependent epimerase/dehydratase family protein [Rariglobus hedericola]
MNRPSLLITGATGAVGRPLLSALLASEQFHTIHALVRDPSSLAASPGLNLIVGDLADPTWSCFTLPCVDVIIHAAASTRFRDTAETLLAINLAGTARLLSWAESLGNAPRFIHLSTCCVAGKRSGEILETPLSHETDFVNTYELTKWQAEQRVHSSPLGPEIVRLATVAGSEIDGTLSRPGALHASLKWFRRGLLPLIPGASDTPIDLISTELVTRFITKLLNTAPTPHAIYHLSAGSHALSLSKLLELAASQCRMSDQAWRRGQILAPVIATKETFDAFRISIMKSRDLLFNEVLASADLFLPVLLFSKRFSTSQAEHIWGGKLPLPDPTTFVSRVVAAAIPTPLPIL